MNPVEIPAGEGCLLVQLSDKTQVLHTKHSDQERELPLLLSHSSSLHEERTALTQEFRGALKRPPYVAHHTVPPSGAMNLEIPSWFSLRNDLLAL